MQAASGPLRAPARHPLELGAFDSPVSEINLAQEDDDMVHMNSLGQVVTDLHRFPGRLRSGSPWEEP